MKKKYIAGILVIACVVGAFAIKGFAGGKSGRPTALEDTSRPVLTLHALREEFLLLKKPVLQGWKRHKPHGTIPSINAPSIRYPEFYEPRLTRQGSVFIKKHSRLELIAALLPYIDDPELGAEVAILLSAIPFDMHISRKDVSPITGLIHSTGYKSPAEKGSWNHVDAIHCKVGFAQMFGLGNTYARWYKSPPTQDTLEGAIAALLDEHERFPFRWTEVDVAAFAERHGNALALSVIYPKAFWPQNYGKNWELGVLLDACNLHEEFHILNGDGQLSTAPFSTAKLEFNSACSKAIIEMAKNEASND